MIRKNLARLLLATALVGALSLVAPAPADARSDIDVSKLVPTLSTTFAPWDCRQDRTGIVCSGERHQRLAPEEVDFGCHRFPVHRWLGYEARSGPEARY